ncbi:hypothetical protein AAXB25_14580 [Paenibacillus lautus]|uniref:hypothetical protein n=1 Tax=Paenibacillus lautus TaxID=1401 RepID=UPI003D2DC4E4
MPSVALNGATISESTASGHINYERYEYWYTDQDGYDHYHWVGGYTTYATIRGSCNASPNGVYFNGKNAVLQGDRTTENDQYSIPDGRYQSGAHSGASGSVTSGNGKNVFIGGKSVSVNGSTISTHAGTSSTINGGVSNNVYIGG